MSYLTTKTQYITVGRNRRLSRTRQKASQKLHSLLMLAHLAATSDNWGQKLLDLIARKTHVIVVDLPGSRCWSRKSETTTISWNG